MTSDPNWNKTGIYYLVVGHACDVDFILKSNNPIEVQYG